MRYRPLSPLHLKIEPSALKRFLPVAFTRQPYDRAGDGDKNNRDDDWSARNHGPAVAYMLAFRKAFWHIYWAAAATSANASQARRSFRRKA